MSIRNPELTLVGSQQIEITRSMCIFFIVFAHIPPYGGPSYMDITWLWPVEFLLDEFISRASVPALCFSSGYLLVLGYAKVSFPKLARKKFMRIYVPILTWNFVGILLTLLGFIVGSEYKEMGEYFASLTVSEILSGWLGITGEVYTSSLAFLRELFVSQLVLTLAIPLIARAPIPIMAIGIVFLSYAGIDEILAPFVLRAEIFMYVLVGVCLALSGLTISHFYNKTLLAGAIVMALIVMVMMLAMAPLSHVEAKLLEQPMRFSMAIMALFIAMRLVDTRPGIWLAKQGDMIYLVFLSHMVVVHFTLAIYVRSGAAWTDPYYLIYFSTIAFLCFGAALLVYRTLRYMPKPVQIAFYGRPIRAVSTGEAASRTQSRT